MIRHDRARPHRELRQVKRRQHEAQQHGQGAGEKGGQRSAGRKGRRFGAMAEVGGDGEAGATAGMPFQQDQPDRDGDQHERDLRRALAISHAVPGPVDRRRESVDAVILDGAEIGERLQQGERRAGRDGRPGQRQADAQESPPRSVAQDAAGFEQRL